MFFVPTGVPVPPNLIALDIPVLLAVAFVCVPVCTTGREVRRVEGGLLVAAHLTYLPYLIVERA